MVILSLQSKKTQRVLADRNSRVNFWSKWVFKLSSKISVSALKSPAKTTHCQGNNKQIKSQTKYRLNIAPFSMFLWICSEIAHKRYASWSGWVFHGSPARLCFIVPEVQCWVFTRTDAGLQQPLEDSCLLTSFSFTSLAPCRTALVSVLSSYYRDFQAEEILLI